MEKLSQQSITLVACETSVHTGRHNFDAAVWTLGRKCPDHEFAANWSVTRLNNLFFTLESLQLVTEQRGNCNARIMNQSVLF